MPWVVEAVWRWEPYVSVDVERTGGPERVVTNDPDPKVVRRHAGFVPPPRPPVDEPLTWEGDDS